MDFKTVWTNLSADEKRALAQEMETVVDYLSQLAHGYRHASKRFARDLSKNVGCDPRSVMREQDAA